MGDSSDHRLAYKLASGIISTEELRRRRESEGVRLRKYIRYEQLAKRRNLSQASEQGFAKSPDLSDLLLSSEKTQVNNVIDGLSSANREEFLQALKIARTIVGKSKSCTAKMLIRLGLVRKLIEFLSLEDEEIQTEATWALANLAGDSSEYTTTVVEEGAVPHVVQLLSSSSHSVKEQAMWVLGNVSGDGPAYRDLVLEHGALDHLIQLLPTGPSKLPESFLRTHVWLLSNLCRGRNPPPIFSVVSRMLPVLAKVLHVRDTAVLTDACWALSYLSDGDNGQIETVVESGVCRRLVELLMTKNPGLQSAALRAVGNIATGSDLSTQVLINCNVLPCLRHLLADRRLITEREACWILSNIAAGTRAQLQALINCMIVPMLITRCNKGDFKTRKEAAWTIVNAASTGSPEQIQYLFSVKAVPALSDLLTSCDHETVHLCLSGLEHILRWGKANHSPENPVAIQMEECRGLEKLEYLQTCLVEKNSTKANHLIDTYFSGLDHDEDVLLLSTGEQNGNCAFGSRNLSNDHIVITDVPIDLSMPALS